MAIKKKYTIDNRDAFSLRKIAEDIKELQEGNYKVYVCDSRDQRSLNQNAYYWGVVVAMISEHTGEDKSRIHEVLAYLYNPKVMTYKDDLIKYPGTTRELNTKEFEAYLEQCRIWASDKLGLDIPDPNEMTEDQLIHFYSEHE